MSYPRVKVKPQPKHFSPNPVPWTEAKKLIDGPLTDGEGGQGAIFACKDVMEGIVAKLYKTERPRADMMRAMDLIRVCKSLDPSADVTAAWLERLNVPLRPILSPAGEFGGMFLPPIPAEVAAVEFHFDRQRRTMVPTAQRVKFEAQFLSQQMSPVGANSEQWQWRILFSLVETVTMMHSANLVHGDLSMSNVLVRQVDGSHKNDSIYLIDIDDTFLDDGGQRLRGVIRRSPYTFDPASVTASVVTKETDVFVVALWIVAFMENDFGEPANVARTVPKKAKMRLEQAGPELARLVSRALGPLGTRPTMMDIYKSMWPVARRFGAANDRG